MTPKQIEALKLALEALEWIAAQRTGGMIQRKAMEPIVAIREVLKDHAMQEVQRLGQEIEQEIEPDDIASILACRDMLDAQPVPPRTWVGLTDEDMYVVSEEESCSFIAGAKWSEAILKEKNT